MAEQEKLHIKLNVYDTELSVNVPRSEEEYYRKSAKFFTPKEIALIIDYLGEP